MRDDTLGDDLGEQLAGDIDLVGLLLDRSIGERGDKERPVLDRERLDGRDPLCDTFNCEELGRAVGRVSNV